MRRLELEEKKKSTRHLEPFEKETIVCFDEAGDDAACFTYKKALRTHFEKVLGLKPDFVNAFGGAEYTVRKAWYRKPRLTRTRKGESSE